MMRAAFGKLLKFFWSALGGKAWDWSPPYEYVFEITAERIHDYLGIPRNQVLTWCIVGGYLGLEVPKILRAYPRVKIDIFECSRRYFPALARKFSSNKRVDVVNRAVSAQSGNLTFFETTLSGSGSVLALGEAHKEFYGSEQAESFEVEAITLDSFYEDALTHRHIDVLQIDVQGAEMLVLQGAIQVLARTRSVFVEVSQVKDLYHQSVTFSELSIFLEQQGFQLCLLGSDVNGTGNALFLKSSAKTGFNTV